MKRICWMLSVLLLCCCTALAEWEAPEQLHDQFSSANGKVTVVIDASVELPQTDVFPVDSVQRRIFTDAELTAMANACFDEGRYQVLNEYGQPLSPQPETLQPTALAESPYMLHVLLGNESGRLTVNYTRSPQGVFSRVTASFSRMTQASEVFTMGADAPIAPVPDSIGGLTLQTAQAKAENIAQSVCPDWQVAAVEAYPTKRYTDLSAVNYTSEQAGQTYVFHFTRRVGQAAVTYEKADGTHLDNQQDTYTFPFAYERFWVALNESGVLGMTYTSPYAISERLTEDAQLLPFASIHAVAKTTLPLKYAASKRKGGVTVTIERIVLGYTRVHRMDAPEQFQLIPVWDFMGSVTYADGYSYGGPHVSQLCINAQTGMVIDRDFGY